jgi:hypothetical protein
MSDSETATLAEISELAKALRWRYERDQEVRGEGIPERIRTADRDNIIWLRTVIRKYGWPGISLVGEEAAKYAWLLILHADSAITFQRQCLELLIEAVDQGQAPAWKVAYLTDRVLMHRGLKQRYATQYQRSALGGWEPLPIENPSEVDSWRANLGLPPLAEAGVHTSPPNSG